MPCFPLLAALLVRQRVSTNMSFFTTNYLMICATCTAVYILRSPGMLLTLLLSLCMFVYVFMSRRKPLVVLDVTLGTREKTIAAAAGSYVFLLLLYASSCFLWRVCLPGTVINTIRGVGVRRTSALCPLLDFVAFSRVCVDQVFLLVSLNRSVSCALTLSRILLV